MTFLEEVIAHAADCAPEECCGLVVASGKKHRIIRSANLAAKPRFEFEISEDAWLAVAENEEVTGIYHSHTNGNADATPADLTMCEATGLTWHIVSFPLGHYKSYEPSGYAAPYIGRPYVHAIHDCYAIGRDWYNREWNLGLPDVPRKYEWWLNGEDLYRDNFAKFGFRSLIDSDAQIGDAFLIQVNSPVINHMAVYIGDGKILHHVDRRISSIDVYGGMWVKCTVEHLRHESRMQGG